MPIDALLETTRYAPQKEVDAARRMYEAQMAAERQAEAEAAAAIAAQRAQAQQLWNGYDYNAEAERRAQVGGYTPAPEAFRAPTEFAPRTEYDPQEQARRVSAAWQPSGDIETSRNNRAAYIPGTQIEYGTERGDAYLALAAQRDSVDKAAEPFNPFKAMTAAGDARGALRAGAPAAKAYNALNDASRAIGAEQDRIGEFLNDEEYRADKAATAAAIAAQQRRENLDPTEAAWQLDQLKRQYEETKRTFASTNPDDLIVDTSEKLGRRDEILDNLAAQIAQLEGDLTARQNETRYAQLMRLPDFEQNSQYVPHERIETDAIKDPSREGIYAERDVLYEAVNGNRTAINQYNRMTGNSGNYDGLAYMTDDERRIYNYLYARDMQSEDSFARDDPETHGESGKYLKEILPTLNARMRSALEADIRAEAKAHPFAMSVASVLTSPLKTVSYASQLAELAATGKIDQNAAGSAYAYMDNAVRSTVSREIERNWGKSNTFAYNTAMSMADNLWQMFLTGGPAGEGAMLAIMGTGAAADAVIAAKDRGLTDAQAFALGTATGAIEVLTEKIGFDNLYNVALRGDTAALKALLSQTLAEGSEEFAGSVLDNLADMIIAGVDSEHYRRVRALVASGMSETEAIRRAWAEDLGEAGMEALSGALSGMLMSSGGRALQSAFRAAPQIAQNIRDTREQNRVDEMVRMANEEAAQRYANLFKPQQTAQTEQTAAVPSETPANPTVSAPTAPQTATDTATQTAQETPIQNGENGQSSLFAADDGGTTITESLPSDTAQAAPAQSNAEQTATDGTNVGGELTPLSPKNEESSVGAATAGQFSTEFNELGEKYGWQEVTAKDAAYAARYPRSTNGKDRVSAAVGNALSARVTDDYMASLIEANTVKGAYSFIPISNDATTRKATRRIKNIGWEAAMKEFHDAARTGKNSADLQAMGMILYNNAVNSGDYQAALNILADFQVSGTTIARALQIRQILRKLTPEGKLYSIQKAIGDLNQQLTNKGRNMIGEPFVFEYSDAVGRKVADGVAKKLQVKSPKAQTFLQHIAAEISEIANEQIPADVKEDTKRARRDFVRDYILNHDFFDEAYQKAKEEIVHQYEDRGEEIPPELEELLNSSLRDAMYEQLVGRSDVAISDEALEAYAYAQTPTEEQEAMKRIAKEISSQLPSTLEEKINALRYLNMLGNFRTQNRNILGNSAMFLAASAKYYTAAGIERIVSRINPNFEKSKAVNPGKARLDAARQAFKTYEDYVLGEAKYNDMNSRSSNEIMRMAEDEKTVFKFGDNRLTRALGIANKQGPLGKALEAMRNATNWMMEHGDIPFAKVSFVRSLAGYMAAHNVTAEQWNNPEWQTRNASFVDKAIQYAANQAQQDTFRDNNAFSTWVSKFGRTPNTPKAARVALEGLLPFRKTPANVTVRAVEYSPLGILTTAVDAVKAAQGGEKNGRVVTGADIVDDIAKNFTGTALVALGWILAKQGILRGGDDDDDKVAAWNDQLGHQSYSIEIGGTSYTLDWVAPAAIPLFIGAEIFNATKGKNYSFSDLEGAFTKITEPMLKMSMLQSVDDFLNGGYDSNGLQKVAQLGASYLTQGLTSTLLGQLERTLFEPNRVATYKDPTRNMPKWLQGAIGKASAKIPGIDAYQYEYVDLWGRSESNGSMWERALTNFLSPGYVSHVDMDSVETEIQRLYDYLTESGSDEASSVLPAAVKRTGLSREDYVKKAQTVGAARAGVLSSMFATQAYQHMSPEDQAKAVQCVYEYANATAKADTSKSAKWIRDALSSRDPAQVILRHVRAS